MTKGLAQIFCISTLLSVAFSATFRASAHQTQDVLSLTTTPAADDYQPYICPDTGDEVVPCLAYITDACVCYKNGTCINTQANRCLTCQEEDAISVTEGVTCAQEQIDGTPYRCRPSQIDEPPVCPAVVIPACVCYTNGTCAQSFGSSCTDCWKNDVAYVIEHGTCPSNGIQPITHTGVNTQEGQGWENEEEEKEESADLTVVARIDEDGNLQITTPNSGFQYYICPDNAPAVTSCTTELRNACVCYSNGTCVDTQANACSTCFDQEVVSVTVDEACPVPALDGEWTRCVRNPAIEILCTLEVTEGCICFSSGECEKRMVNACQDCQRENVALVIEGGSCPAGGIQALV